MRAVWDAGAPGIDIWTDRRRCAGSFWVQQADIVGLQGHQLTYVIRTHPHRRILEFQSEPSDPPIEIQNLVRLPCTSDSLYEYNQTYKYRGKPTPVPRLGRLG